MYSDKELRARIKHFEQKFGEDKIQTSLDNEGWTVSTTASSLKENASMAIVDLFINGNSAKIDMLGSAKLMTNRQAAAFVAVLLNIATGRLGDKIKEALDNESDDYCAREFANWVAQYAKVELFASVVETSSPSKGSGVADDDKHKGISLWNVKPKQFNASGEPSYPSSMRAPQETKKDTNVTRFHVPFTPIPALPPLMATYFSLKRDLQRHIMGVQDDKTVYTKFGNEAEWNRNIQDCIDSTFKFFGKHCDVREFRKAAVAFYERLKDLHLHHPMHACVAVGQLQSITPAGNGEHFFYKFMSQVFAPSENDKNKEKKKTSIFPADTPLFVVGVLCGYNTDKMMRPPLGFSGFSANLVFDNGGLDWMTGARAVAMGNSFDCLRDHR